MSGPHHHHHHHHHGHPHEHPHGHGRAHDHEAAWTPYSDTSVPDADLSPVDLSRRRFLQAAGVLGLAVGATVAGTPRVAQAAPRPGGGGGGSYTWLNGDHHIHTQYSSDGLYTVRQQVEQARRNGVNWLVITDHGSATHARLGVDLVNPDIVAARQAYRDMLVFQGLEWNIPAAEHGTVFVVPNANEVAVLREFEQQFDGSLGNVTEDRAVAGIQWLGRQMTDRRTSNALFLANHPARNGIDSPHEIRAWRDADPRVAIGMEGAPGHQAAGIPAPEGPGEARGYYGNSRRADSFPGYPDESYRTFGGFDWMTAKLGGVWDSLLAEGRPWWITANSDSHSVYRDQLVRPAGQDNSAYFTANGRYGDPVDGGTPLVDRGDFFPGYYSRTWVGAGSRDHGAVMDGLRAGRAFVVHGDLIDGLEVSVRGDGGGDAPATLGEQVRIGRGENVHVQIRITQRRQPNAHGDVPRLRRVDLITGPITGPVADRDTQTAPGTRVAQSFEVRGNGQVVLNHVFRRVDRPFFLRLRGTDGNFSAPGTIEPRQDPVGNSDPWTDLWFYSNPVFVSVG
ncbi:PHP domain-containing protein [Geodermatophilus sp. SYSU D01119]